jgi:hypothetical protein
MSSSPPGDSDERGPGASQRGAGFADESVPIEIDPGSDSGARDDGDDFDVDEEQPLDPDELGVEVEEAPTTGTGGEGWLARAALNDPEADVAFHEAEAAAYLPATPRRAAPLLHEAAHLRDSALGREREAAKAYAHALTVDPSFQPNAWALRRMFVRRGFWDNLVRVMDAEVRFAPWARQSDRADLQVERGRVLEDRLGREVEALASYKAALDVAPDHAAALWAQLLHGWRTGATAEAEAALAGLLRRVPEPRARAVIAIELARLQRRVSGDAAGTVSSDEEHASAADTLLRALATGADADPLLRELDRLSLLTDKPDLRLRYLDAFESRSAREVLDQESTSQGVAYDPPPVAAVINHFREKARILHRRGARDAAHAVLDRTVAVGGAHPLVVHDFLDAVEEGGRADAIAGLLDGPLADGEPEARAEALLRRAEMVERAGAFGEAIGALDRLPAGSALAPLAALARLRVLARLQDAEGLARAFAAVAATLEQGSPADRIEAAHLLVRAASARRRAGDPTAAEPLLRRALALVPGYGPAAAGLASALAHATRFGELASFVDAQAAAVQDPARARALREMLVVLQRDVLVDGREALRQQRALLEAPDAAAADDLRNHLRMADLAGLAASQDPEAAALGVRSLEWLAQRMESGPVAAGLRLLAARLLGATDPQSQETAEALLRQAASDDPGSGAAAALERRYLESDRRDRSLEVLGAELRAAEQSGRERVARALRYRLSHVAFGAGEINRALGHLEPLRRRGDRLAIAWSLDLARRARRPLSEAAVLSELALLAPDGEGNGLDEAAGVANELTSAFERTWALAEALEEGGDLAGAADAFKEASARAANVDAGRWADVELGIFRCHLAQGQTAEAAASLRRLALFLEGDAGAAVRREAALWSLSAGLGAEEEPGTGGGDGIWRWLHGVRAGDPHEVVAGIEQMAAGATTPSSAAGLWALAGVRKAVLGDPGAVDTLERAARALAGDGGEPPEVGGPAWAAATATGGVLAIATDLAGPGSGPGGAGPLPPALAALRRARADRLRRGDLGEQAVAVGLLLDEAMEEEAAGRLRSSARAYCDVLAMRPDSVQATEGLRRIAEAVEDRRGQAAALARRGALSRARRRAAESYAEAALLLEEEGLDAQAALLFQRVLERIPDDAEAYHRLHEILTRREDAAGLERLYGFKLRQTADPQVRVRLYAERARLRLDQLGERERAIHDLRRILLIDPAHAPTLRELGRLALEDRRHAVAARLLEQAAAHETEPEALLELQVQIADAHEGAGNPTAASRWLARAAENQPDASGPRERMIALAVRRGDHEQALAQLRALERRAGDDAGRAAVLIRIGRLERDERHDTQRALAAFRDALGLDPLGEAASELATVVAGGAVLGDQDRGVINDAIEELRDELLEQDPVDVPRLGRLRDLARLRGLTELAEVAAQLLGALGVGAERGRPRELGRPMSLPPIAGLMAGDGGAAPAGAALLAEIWPHVGEAVARVEGASPAQMGVTKQTRVTPGMEPRLQWLEAASLSLGLAPLAIHVAGNDELAVVPLGAPEPTLIVGRGVLGGDPASRFRVGRALFLLRLRAGPLEHLGVPALEDIVRAVAVLAGARSGAILAGADPGALKARSKVLARAMGRRELRALEAYAGRLENEAVDLGGWRKAVLRGADRFGLLVSSDLGAAVRVLAGAGPEPRPADLRRPQCLDLIRFALDDRYAIVRRELGLAGGDRP